jgi:ABC-type transporter Mla subunit MlaD
MKLRVALAAALLASTAASVWLSLLIGRQSGRIEALERQLKTAQSHPAAVSPPAPQAPPTVVATPAAREGRTASRAPAETPGCPDTTALNARLQESAATLARVQGRIAELEEQVEELSKERSRIAASETEAQSRIAELNSALGSLNAERPQIDKRIRDVEAENARLRQQSQASTQRYEQFGKLVTELQEVARRQQVYTTSVLRRYRELTDLFRTLPGVVENKGNGPELARIQSAISLADEDLRQLNELNARLGRVHKQIAAAAAR